MRRFVEGTDRGQSTLFPECLEDWIDENNPVQVIDVFVDELDRKPSRDLDASRQAGWKRLFHLESSQKATILVLMEQKTDRPDRPSSIVAPEPESANNKH
jgi:hypothetical protein